MKGGCLFAGILVVALGLVGPVAAVEYRINDLGIDADWESGPFAINDAGQVVGGFETSPHSWVFHPFLWADSNGNGQADPCEIIDLGTIGDDSYNIAYAINNSGQVVGLSGECAFLWEDSNDNGQSDPGEMIDLGTLAGEYTEADAINNSGQVVGSSGNLAFLWEDANGNGQSDPGEIIDLGTLGGSWRRARGINDFGQVVGSSASTFRRAFLWEDTDDNGQSDVGEMIDLGTLGGDHSSAFAINNNGQVVGDSELSSGSYNAHAFLWEDLNGNSQSDPGEMIDLDTLGNDYSWAVAINNAGQVVGVLENAGPGDNRRAFLWNSEQGMVNLNDLLPPDSGWTSLMAARDINERGQILGWGITDSDEWHAFLMTPLIPGDLTDDGKVDFKDFAVLGLGWRSSPGDDNWNQICDISDPNDDIIDERDLDVLTEHWLAGVE